MAAAFAVVLPGRAHAGPCDAPANAIVAENCLPGDSPDTWDVSGAGDPSIQGFATDISVNRGSTVFFKVDTDSTNYRLDIYRMGYYGGLGARQVATVQPSAALPQNQPACLSDPSTGLVDCGNWAVSASWNVPANATSGIYFALLVREDGVAGASHVVFVVRDDGGGSALFFQTSDTTWQAYNQYGGNSLYVGSPAGRAYKVSYNRPFTTRGPTPEDWVFNAEYPMVRWLEANGYDVSYTTGVDTARRGAELLEHRVFLSVGHDEYWSGDQRANVEAARDAGVHLAFFSGNEVFWKTRWENSIDGAATPYRTLVTYKETHANAKIDPLAERVDRHVARSALQPARRRRPARERADRDHLHRQLLLGRHHRAAGRRQACASGATPRVATLGAGQTATLAPETLGYEWDEDLDNGARPAGPGPPLDDDRHRAATVCSTSARTTARARRRIASRSIARPSGALVFGAGTVQWAWGLDDNHDRGSAPPDVRMQQATVNLLADMGVQPATPTGRSGRGHRVDRRDTADDDDHLAGRRCGRRERRHGGDQRHRRGRRWRRGGWRRGVGRRRHHLASGHRSRLVDLLLGRPGAVGLHHADGARRRRQRQPRSVRTAGDGDHRGLPGPESGSGRSDPGRHAGADPFGTLLRRDPARRGAASLRGRRHRERVGGDPRGLRRRHSRRDAAHRRAGDDAEQLGDGGRQPHRDAARRAARPAARADDRGRHARRRVPAREHGVGTRRRHRRPDDPVPRHRRPLHRRRRDDGGHALLERLHRHDQPGRDAADRRHDGRPGGGLHLRSRALGRLHAAGQSGLGRSRSATAPRRSAPTTCSSAPRPAIRSPTGSISTRSPSRRPTSSSACSPT